MDSPVSEHISAERRYWWEDLVKDGEQLWNTTCHKRDNVRNDPLDTHERLGTNFANQ